MISAPKNVHGSNLFKIFVEELGGPKRVCKMLGVTKRSIFRWLAEGTAPKTAVLAFYWEPLYGRSLIAADNHNEISLLYGPIRLLEDQFARASQIIAGLKLLHYGTANGLYFDAFGEFTVRPDLAASETKTGTAG